MRLADSLLAKKLLAAAGRAYRRRRPQPPGITILAYHSIGDDPGSSVTVPAPRFAAQLDWLAARYPIVSLDQALDDERPPRDLVVLTFDDGYGDYLTTALPLMKRVGAPSTVFVITGMAAEPGRSFDFAAGRGKRSLTADELVGLAADELVTVGSHTHSHPLLTRLTDARIEDELARSRRFLEELLGARGFHLAYPWAVADRRVEACARRLYRSAAAGRGGKNLAPLDRHRLRRIPVKNEPLALFAERVRGHLFLEDMARERLGRRGGGRSG